MGEPMVDETWLESKGEIKDDVPIWKDKDGKIVSGPRYGGIAGQFQEDAIPYHRITFENGETWDIPDSDQGQVRQHNFNPSMATAWRAKNKRPSAPTVKNDEYGNPMIWDPEATDPKTGRQGTFVPAPGMQTKPRKLLDVTDDRGQVYEYDVNFYDPSTGQQGKYVPKKSALPPKETTINPYASDFTKGRNLYRYNAEGIPVSVFTFPEEEKTLTPWQQAQFDMTDPKSLYDKEQDELKRQQWEQQQEMIRRQQAWRMAADVIGQQQQMAPYALRPGQTHFSSYGPGEAWSQLYPKLGLNYNPDSFKVAPVNIDWQAEWRKAMAAMGGQ